MTTKTKYTNEEKKLYYRGLRERWSQAKELAEKDELIKALYASVGGNFSATSFAMTYADMQRQGMSGVPYIDAKTYKAWVESGFRVRKGEKSTLTGIAWLNLSAKDEDGKEIEDGDFLMPKEYHLFHRSQVEPIEA